jgi:hypothetical protein
MGNGFIRTLRVTGVAQIAKIAEGVTLVPTCTIIVDRVLALDFMAVFARRGL